MDFGLTFAAVAGNCAVRKSDLTREPLQAARQFEMETTVSAPANPEWTTGRPSVD
jgi:hypothetical protein